MMGNLYSSKLLVRNLLFASALVVCASAVALATPITRDFATEEHVSFVNTGSLYNSSIASVAPHQSLVEGQISGRTFAATPHRFAFIVPVDPPPPPVSETPEPSTLTLFGTGLIMFGAAVRRRVRS